MDNSSKKKYNNLHKRKDEVIYMIEALLPGVNEKENEVQFVDKKPESMAELRKMVAMKSAFGKTPRDLYREGK